MRTNFTHKIARERRSLFGQKCELDSVRQVTWSCVRWGSCGKKDRTPLGVHTEGALASTNFAREFPRKRGTSFGRNCEPVFACKHAKAWSMEWWQRQKKMGTRLGTHLFFGGATRNRTGDRGVADLCLTAWPWRHFVLNKWIIAQIFPIVKGVC